MSALSKARLIAVLRLVNQSVIKRLIVSFHVALQPSKSLKLLIIPDSIINLIVSALTLIAARFLLVAIAKSTLAKLQFKTETV
jgi:hypothetical protein